MANPLKISIIIPTLNEAEKIPALLSLLNSNELSEDLEIIICDGNSVDDTIQIAEKYPTKIITSPIPQRAKQMNLGASIASGDILYFLHADCIPPPHFLELILHQIDNNFQFGCFRLKFDNNHWFLKANAWFTRFAFAPFHYGDQSLFITAELFKQIKGFDESLFLMEDQEILVRAKRFGKFVVIPNDIVTSARKYEASGFFRLQFIFYTLYFLYKLGVSQAGLKKLYKKWIR